MGTPQSNRSNSTELRTAVQIRKPHLNPRPHRCAYGCEQYTYEKYHITYQVRADGGYESTTEVQLKINTPQGIRSGGSQSVDYIASQDEVISIEAWTIQPDGTKVNVPAANLADSARERLPMLLFRTALAAQFPRIDQSRCVQRRTFRTNPARPQRRRLPSTCGFRRWAT